MYTDCTEPVYLRTRCTQDTFVFGLGVQIRMYPNCVQSVYIPDSVRIRSYLDLETRFERIYVQSTVHMQLYFTLWCLHLCYSAVILRPNQKNTDSVYMNRALVTVIQIIFVIAVIRTLSILHFTT